MAIVREDENYENCHFYKSIFKSEDHKLFNLSLYKKSESVPCHTYVISRLEIDNDTLTIFLPDGNCKIFSKKAFSEYHLDL